MTVSTLRALPLARRATALYCDVYGRGTPVLLLHDLGTNGSVFRPLVDALAEQYLVIVPDLRGHGHSSRLHGPNSVADMAADVRNLLDLLLIPACYVLGYGAGGAVAQQLAREEPNRVRGLMLVCSYARRSPALFGRLEGRLRRGLARVGTREAIARDSQNSPCDVQRVAEVEHALEHFDSRAWLRSLHCPALVIAGEYDLAAPLQSARELAHGLADAQLAVVPKAGHSLLQTHADAVRDLVLAWLRARQEAAC
ncbi:MAG TPA: alpha/beta hydrolase [Roseiflexaceae bacterium]|jgi:pimeloyl-ACP methyl ester carboxylesterase|nr:alpha/beta hydrolase [Roseiflexaceae bacterium]